MKLEDKVATFIQSQKIIHYGVNFKTHFYWVTDKIGTVTFLDNDPYKASKFGWPVYYPAPDVAELGILLPGNAEIDVDVYKTSNLNEFQAVVYHKFKEDFDLKIFKTEAEARAEALIFLLSKGLIDPSSLKL